MWIAFCTFIAVYLVYHNVTKKEYDELWYLVFLLISAGFLYWMTEGAEYMGYIWLYGCVCYGFGYVGKTIEEIQSAI